MTLNRTCLLGLKLGLAAAGILCLAVAYGHAASPATPTGPAPSSDRARWMKQYQPPPAPDYPAGNTFTADRELLGRTLFFDPRLSGSKFISCATCHNPGFQWSDGLSKAIGHGMKTLNRHTPTILNSAYSDLLFWDGRATSLEMQALGPISAPGEMNLPLSELAARVNSIPGYQPLFAKAYPGEPISETTIAKALAAFERTVVTSPASFDRWISGDEQAISSSAKRGFDLFNRKAECAQCHSGWNFSDSGFHDIGVNDQDLGRGALLKLEAMQHAFKTPTLRNVTLRGPYMHDGSEATLRDVIEFYDAGGKCQRPSLSPEIHPLHLSVSEKADLLDFLNTLASSDRPTPLPLLPR